MDSVNASRFFTVSVSTFGDLRVSLFAANRSLSQLVTSFIGSWCQGIHLMLLFAWTSFSWSITFVAMIDPWFSFFRIAWVSWTFWLSLLACKKVLHHCISFSRCFESSTFRWNCIALSCLPNFILGKTNKMCCFYLSSNICSFSTQNINFYIDFPYSIVKDQFLLTSL